VHDGNGSLLNLSCVFMSNVSKGGAAVCQQRSNFHSNASLRRSLNGEFPIIHGLDDQIYQDFFQDFSIKRFIFKRSGRRFKILPN
jgi:hypothetical protein